MAVSVNATGTASIHPNAVVTTTFTNLTIAAGTNIALIVCFNASSGLTGGLTMTWDAIGANQALTEIVSGTTAAGSWAKIWGLLNPVTGNKTLTVSWTGSANAVLGAMAFNGVLGSLVSNGSARTSGTSVSITPSGTASDASVASVTMDVSSHDTATTATRLYSDANGNTVNGYADYQLGVAAITDTVDVATGQMVSVTVQAAGSVTATPLAIDPQGTNAIFRRVQVLGY